MAENLLDQQMQPPRPAPVEQPQNDEQAMREQQALIEQRRREAEQREAQSRDNLQVKIEEARRERESRAQQDILAGQQKMARFQLEIAKLAEEEKTGQSRAGRTFRFDISTGRYSEAPMTTQQAGAPELASEIILQMGVGTAGRAFRQAGGEAPKVTAEQIMKAEAGQVMTKGVLDALGQLEGGTVAMRRYQDGLSAVQSEIEANLETFKGEDGRIVPEKMAEFVAKSENFIPAMMGQVRNYIDAVAVNTNKVIDDAEKLKAQADKAKNDALITQFQADSIEAKALAGSGHAKARELMGDPAKFAKDFPDAALMLEAGASPADVEYYVAGQLEEAGSTDAQRKAWIRSLGTDAYGEGFTGEGVSDRPVESPLIRNLEANVNNALDRAEQGGEDYVKFAMSELTGDRGDMNEAEYAEYVGQVYDAVQERVSTRVGGRIKEAQGVIKSQVSGAIESEYIQQAELVRTGGSEAFNAYIKSDEFLGLSEEEKRRGAIAKFIEIAGAGINDIDVKNASMAQMLMLTNEQYQDAVARGIELPDDDVFSRIKSIAESVADYSIRNRETIDAKKQEIVSQAQVTNRLVAFDENEKPVYFVNDEFGRAKFVEWSTAPTEQRQFIAENYKKQREARVKLLEEEKGDLSLLRNGQIAIEQYYKPGRLSFSYSSTGIRPITPTSEDHWDAYMQSIERRYYADPEIQARVMKSALEQKKKWEDDLIEKMGITGATASTVREQLRDIGQADVAGAEQLAVRGVKGKSDATKTLKAVANRQLMRSGAGPSDLQPLIPDIKWEAIANQETGGSKIVIQNQGAIDVGPDEVLGFYYNKSGGIVFQKIPAVNGKPTIPEEDLTKNGVYILRGED